MRVNMFPEDIRPSGLAEAYEETRLEQQVQEIEEFKVAFMLRIETLGMVQAISEFYSQQKKDVYNDLLQHATEQFFTSLSAATRLILARKADSFIENETKAAYSSAGGKCEFFGSGYWQAFSTIVDQHGSQPAAGEDLQ